MGKSVNLSGQVFNNLTVLKDSKKRNSAGGILWECQCTCGNVTYASTADLRSGHKKSCGCYKKKVATELGRKNASNLLGKKFGLLTVIEKGKTSVTPNGSKRLYWKCQCDCGSIVEIQAQALIQGNTRSCGCIKSFGEQKIINILTDAGIPFEREKTFKNGITKQQGKMRFDFFVNNKYVIEYDGKQHFQDCAWNTMTEAQEKDAHKNEFCHINNIPIIRIPYTHFNDLDLKDLLLETSTFII